MPPFDYDRKVARTLLRVAEDMGANRDQTLALLAAGLVESNMRNVDYGDRDSRGVLQQRPSQGWGTREQVMNPEYAARQFLKRAMDIDDYSNIGDLAQQVQRSAFPGRYQERKDDAKWLLQNLGFNGGGGGGGNGGGGGGGQGEMATFASLDDEDDEDDDNYLVGILQTISQHMRNAPDPDETPEERMVRQAAGGLTEEGQQSRDALRGGRGISADPTDPNYQGSPTAVERRAKEQTGSLAWGGFDNGRIPLNKLVAIGDVHYSGKATHYFAPNAGQRFKQMRRAARRDGVNITLTDSYRSYQQQVDLRRRKGGQVATADPGTSIHGWGKAIDVAGDDARTWIQRNGARFGWVWPVWARNPGKSYEPWHFEFRP